MTLNELASQIAYREGKKVQTHIGDIREILRIMCEIDQESGGAVQDAIDEAVFVERELNIGPIGPGEQDYGLDLDDTDETN